MATSAVPETAQAAGWSADADADPVPVVSGVSAGDHGEVTASVVAVVTAGVVAVMVGAADGRVAKVVASDAVVAAVWFGVAVGGAAADGDGAVADVNAAALVVAVSASVSAVPVAEE